MNCPTCQRPQLTESPHVHVGWSDYRELLRFTDHGELDERPLPPSQPPGWVDPDPLYVGMPDVEPERPKSLDPRVPWHGWSLEPEPKPTPHWFALVGLGICIGIVIFALIFTIGRAVDAASSETHEPAASLAVLGSRGAPLDPAYVPAAGLADVQPAGTPHPRLEAPVPSPTGAITFVISASATWCAPTPTQCQAWGGNAKLGAVNSFHDGDEPYLVRVSRGSRSVVVLVVSYCACRGTDRAIDLSPAAFKVLAPLSRGRIDVVLEWPVSELPRTDADLRMMLEVRGDELYR